MELRRLGDSVFRSRVPLLPFLAPSVPPAWLFVTKVSIIRHNSIKQRNTGISPFNTILLKQARSSSTSGNSNSLDEPSNSQQRGQQRRSTIDFPENMDARKSIDDLLDGMIPNSKPRTARQDSASDVGDAFRASRTEFYARESSEPGNFASMMEFPNVRAAPASQATDPSPVLLQELKGLLTLNPRNKRTIRSRPKVGRTIELDKARGMDFGRAMRQLNILCATNRVRADAMRQRFHERPGMKRKRLKSERWRKLFKEGFRATVGRVKEMRRKGW
ncbi:MAG: hypothetical protein Q9217_005493 [Psora testacea]